SCARTTCSQSRRHRESTRAARSCSPPRRAQRSPTSTRAYATRRPASSEQGAPPSRSDAFSRRAACPPWSGATGTTRPAANSSSQSPRTQRFPVSRSGTNAHSRRARHESRCCPSTEGSPPSAPSSSQARPHVTSATAGGATRPSPGCATERRATTSARLRSMPCSPASPHTSSSAGSRRSTATPASCSQSSSCPSCAARGTTCTASRVAPPAHQLRAAQLLRRGATLPLETLVSPFVGVVRGMQEAFAGPEDARLPAVWCESAYPHALVGGGSGLSLREARAAAIGEAVERYSASDVDLDACVVATARELGSQAVDPTRFALF